MCKAKIVRIASCRCLARDPVCAASGVSTFVRAFCEEDMFSISGFALDLNVEPNWLVES